MSAGISINRVVDQLASNIKELNQKLNMIDKRLEQIDIKLDSIDEFQKKKYEKLNAYTRYLSRYNNKKISK